jgi:hypothetical protein
MTTRKHFKITDIDGNTIAFIHVNVDAKDITAIGLVNGPLIEQIRLISETALLHVTFEPITANGGLIVEDFSEIES